MSDTFPPPPPEQPRPEHPAPQPEASPWAAPAAAPERGRQRTGLVVALSVGGGLALVGAVTALVYTLMGTVTDSMDLPPERSAAPYGAEPGEPAEEPGATEESDAADVADVADDVTITACTRDPQIGWPAADVEVVNGSAAPADYYVSVEFLDKDGATVAEGVTGVLGLGPGESAEKKVQGLGEVPSGTTCRLDDLARTPSAG
ncbi:hypothetical protein [Streptomyces pratensis]|uniref:hypothetical protein n=1 Tax=Streptomyces pratensis TaxID=1169025 RepID=UPI003019BBA4